MATSHPYLKPSKFFVTRMKKIFLLIALLYVLTGFSQRKFIGTYKDHFGSELVLNKNSTFEYSWKSDSYKSWSVGTWTVLNDTLRLFNVPIYDTLTIQTNNARRDSLVFSEDYLPQRINRAIYEGYQVSAIVQNRKPFPPNFFYKKKMLFEIAANGQLVTDLIYLPSIKGKVTPQYFKQPW